MSSMKPNQKGTKKKQTELNSYLREKVYEQMHEMQVRLLLVSTRVAKALASF
jgi:hypothetical protein